VRQLPHAHRGLRLLSQLRHGIDGRPVSRKASAQTSRGNSNKGTPLMALTCARCGAQNPDGNQFCQACGTPLVAPGAVAPTAIPGPPPGPPPAFPSPPAAYASPYYMPSGAAVPVHRTPWTLIIAGVVALTVLMAGFGTALAIVANRGAPNTSGTGIGDVPTSPTPGVTPSPVASPTPSSSTTGTSNDGFTLTVPSGWTVDSKTNESMVLTDSNGEGSVTIASGSSIPPQTAQQNKDTVDSALKTSYPDTRDCPGTKATATTFNGASGISWTLCFTITQGANSVPAAASVFAGANSGGGVYYIVMVLTSQNNLQSYVNASRPLVQSIHWKLS
jgi:hypothetical protein